MVRARVGLGAWSGLDIGVWPGLGGDIGCVGTHFIREINISVASDNAAMIPNKGTMTVRALSNPSLENTKEISVEVNIQNIHLMTDGKHTNPLLLLTHAGLLRGHEDFPILMHGGHA